MPRNKLGSKKYNVFSQRLLYLPLSPIQLTDEILPVPWGSILYRSPGNLQKIVRLLSLTRRQVGGFFFFDQQMTTTLIFRFSEGSHRIGHVKISPPSSQNPPNPHYGPLISNKRFSRDQNVFKKYRFWTLL